MNRSILIVICDFLLVSLLVFSTPDLTKLTNEGAQTGPPPAPSAVTNAANAGNDLAAVMRTALTEEQRKREQLMGELEKTRQAAAQQQTALNQSEKQIQNFQQQVQSREQQARELQEAQAKMQQQFAAAQTNIQALSQQLHASATEAVVSKDQASALQQQLADLEKANQAMLAEKEKLTNQLQLAELEKRHAAEQAAQMQQQVEIQREENSRLQQQAATLAEGVKALANKSGELAKEIRENRPLASNTIFNEFLTNRVEAEFTATRPGLFGGEATRQKAATTVLVTDGTNTFALCHVQDTPLTLGVPGTDWQALSGNLRHGAVQVSLQTMSFCWPDPRVVLIPVSAAQTGRLDAKVYRTSADPYKFQDAVLVGAQQGYYGECKFQIDLKTPGYVKLDRSILKGLFGKFNPSRGDLVFSRTGELLGIMANDTYCMMIRKFDTSATLRLGSNVGAEHTGNTLASLYGFVSGLPAELR